MKKNVLFLTMCPPSHASQSLVFHCGRRFKPLANLSVVPPGTEFWKNGVEFKTVLRNVSDAPPCRSLVPDLTISSTIAPLLRPYSASNDPVTTRNSDSAL